MDRKFSKALAKLKARAFKLGAKKDDMALSGGSILLDASATDFVGLKRYVALSVLACNIQLLDHLLQEKELDRHKMRKAA